MYSLEMARSIAYQIYSGFWSVNTNACFFDKGEALRYASMLSERVLRYHYFDEVYSTVDWGTEPTETLSQLYKSRALQLRDEYEYVALSFSGGADSTNVLKSFINNNIKLDEVVVWYPIKATEKVAHTFDPNNKSAGNIIHEYEYAALPMLKWLAVHHPEIKITVLDYTDVSFDIVSAGNMHKSTIGGCVSHAMTTGQYLMTDHLRKVKKKCCQLLAVDKPRVRYNKDSRKFECYFLDFNSLLGHWPSNTFNKDEPKTEYFYYSFQMPKILIKQCYEIKKALLYSDEEQHYDNDVMSTKSHMHFNPHTDFIKKVLYADWDTSVFQADKAIKYFYHEHTTWFLDRIRGDKRMMDFYNGQIKEMTNGVHSSFIDYENGKPIRFKNLISRTYTF